AGVYIGSNVSQYFGSVTRIDSTTTVSAVSAELYHFATPSHRSLLIEAFDRACDDAAAQFDFDDTQKQAAKAAVDEAVAVLSGLYFVTMPWIGIADDQTAMAQWQRGDDGIGFIFMGHRIFGVATKEGAGSLYTKNYQEYVVGIDLPADT